MDAEWLKLISLLASTNIIRALIKASNFYDEVVALAVSSPLPSPTPHSTTLPPSLHSHSASPPLLYSFLFVLLNRCSSSMGTSFSHNFDSDDVFVLSTSWNILLLLVFSSSSACYRSCSCSMHATGFFTTRSMYQFTLSVFSCSLPPAPFGRMFLSCCLTSTKNILGILQSMTCFRLYGLDVLWTTYVFKQQANQVGVFLPHSAIQRGLFTMPQVHICSNF